MAKEYCKVKLATEIKFLLHFTIRSTMILLILLLTHPLSNVITISQCFVNGNISTRCDIVGLNGLPGYFFVGGLHNMAASLTNVAVGLQLT